MEILEKTIIQQGLLSKPLPAIGNSVHFTYTLKNQQNQVLQQVFSKTLVISQSPSPKIHQGISLALNTMRQDQQSEFLLPPGFHTVLNYLDQPIKANIILEMIDQNHTIILPASQPYIYQVQLLQGEIIKRVVEEGQGQVIGQNYDCWVTIQGRTQQGFLFQKPKEEVVNKKKRYCGAWEIAFMSMKRKEIAWVWAVSTHHGNQQFQTQPLWYLFHVREVLLIRDLDSKKINPLEVSERIDLAIALIEDGNRLRFSDLVSTSETLYNKAYTILSIKKDVYNELGKDIRNIFDQTKARSLINSALVMFLRVDKLERDPKNKLLGNIERKLKQSLTFVPENVKVFYNLARVYQKKNQIEKALEFLEEGLKINPQESSLKRYFQILTKTLREQQKKQRRNFQNMIYSQVLEEKEKDLANCEDVDQPNEQEQKKMEVQEDSFSNNQEEYEKMHEEEKESIDVSLEDMWRGVVIDFAQRSIRAQDQDPWGMIQESVPFESQIQNGDHQ